MVTLPTKTLKQNQCLREKLQWKWETLLYITDLNEKYTWIVFKSMDPYGYCSMDTIEKAIATNTAHDKVNWDLGSTRYDSHNPLLLTNIRWFKIWGNSLVVKDSALPLQGAQVQFLVRELKPRKMYSTAKKKKKYLNIYMCVYKTILKAHFN